MTPLGWAAPGLRDHATLAAGLRAARGGLPGRGAADALRDPLPEAGPQQGRRGGHPRAAGGAQEPGHPPGPGRRGGGSRGARPEGPEGLRRFWARAAGRRNCGFQPANGFRSSGMGRRASFRGADARQHLKAYRYFSE